MLLPVASRDRVVEYEAPRGPRAVFFVVEPNRGQLIELGRRIVAGELRAIVGSASALAEGRTAFAAKQRGGSPGKTVLQVAAAPR
jgi:hypothetical protein